MSSEETIVKPSVNDVTGAVDAVEIDAVEVDDAALQGFVAVYHDWYPAMVRLGVLILGDQAASEEVVQDAFTAAYRRWSRIADPVPYVRRSVVNGSRDVLRRRHLARALHLGRDDDRVEAARTEHVDDLLAVLPSRQRAVVVLRFYEDLTIEEIGATLRTRPGTVKSLLHRGLARLREEIEQ